MRVVSIAAFLVACSAGAPPVRAAADPPTAVTTYAPEIPAGVAERAGSCWTASDVAPRADAWRCAMGDVIVDPCFSVAGHDGVVVCGASPATGERGFPLRLDKPLPARTPPGKARPWLLELASGEACTPLTGARSRVGGEFAQWSCGASLVTRVEQGAEWTVVLHRPNGDVARVAVRRAWM